MNEQEFVELIRTYPEWEDDEDETCCPTGWAACPVCGGSGWVGSMFARKPRNAKPPVHELNCLRAKYEAEYGGK